MKRGILLIVLVTLILHFPLAENALCKAEQPAIKKDFSLEYANDMGFKKGQILNVEYVDNSKMKLYVNECSFCSTFKNPSKRDALARKTLGWFLKKKGYKEGTVEWYNKSNQKIMSISGDSSKSEIMWGQTCSINSK